MSWLAVAILALAALGALCLLFWLALLVWLACIAVADRLAGPEEAEVVHLTGHGAATGKRRGGA